MHLQGRHHRRPSKPAFQQAWAIVKSEAESGPDFVSFVDQCINYPQSRLIA